MEKVKYLRPLN